MTTYRQLLEKILIKKAKGYSYREKTEEFNVDDGTVVLVKRKVTTKRVQPDISAVKALVELFSDEQDVTRMTDEQLAVEKLRLIRLLNICDEDGKSADQPSSEEN